MAHSEVKPATEESLFLANAYQQGTSQDTKIFRRYYERLVRLIEPRIAPNMQGVVDAEELAQSVMWQTLRLDPSDREVSTANGSLWPLLAIKGIRRVYRAHRDATTKKRDGGKIQSIHAGHAEGVKELEIADEGTSAEDEAAYKELKKVALDCLTSSTDRKVFELHLEGKTAEEIMDKLGCSSRTVNRSLQHAQEAIEQELKKWIRD